MDVEKYRDIADRLDEAKVDKLMSLSPPPKNGEDLPYGYVAYVADRHNNRINTLRIMNTLGMAGMKVVGIVNEAIYFEDPAVLARHHTPPGHAG